MRDLQDNLCYVEGIDDSEVVDDVLTVGGNIVLDCRIPLGHLRVDELDRDVACNMNVVLSNYLEYRTYFAYFTKLTYVRFRYECSIHEGLHEILKNYPLDIYRVEIILGGCLKDMGGYKEISSYDCYEYNIIDRYHVQIHTPKNLLPGKVICMTFDIHPQNLYVVHINTSYDK